MEIKKSPLGRTYQVRGIYRIPDSEKWGGREMVSKWIERIRYSDTLEEVYLFFDYNGKVVKKQTETPDFIYL